MRAGLENPIRHLIGTRKRSYSRARRRGRRIKGVPMSVLFLLAFGFMLQIAWRWVYPPPSAHAELLPVPPSTTVLRLANLGDPLVTAKLLMLWLQAFDNQPGIKVPFQFLDYRKLRHWLARILDLDPRGQYPLLVASRLYAQVPIENKQRIMLEFVHEQFLKDPNRRWPWIAHGVILAKHRLKDLPLALKYARAITDHATGSHIPYWVRDMSIIILEEMGRLADAHRLIDRLLGNKTITDPREIGFLKGRREAIKRKTQAR
uniref:Uncharacterized protein n=1 Tax=Candidatus Kentrum sp. TUN TaxID=2126343 RepID=A0A450ZZP5_9GAMM|nr:MAG: hypothetical protein BECKTUN1418D_GA0071000_10985 [Candidatus Kentron sp. TUN]